MAIFRRHGTDHDRTVQFAHGRCPQDRLSGTARLWQARQKNSHHTLQFVCRDRAGRFDVKQMVLVVEAQRELFKPVLEAGGS